MSDTYTPLIPTPDGGFGDVNVITLQEHIQEVGATHVRTTKGKIWKIFAELNKKSVPLNNAGEGPQRINFGTVESFGVMADDTTETPAPDTTPDVIEHTPDEATGGAPGHADREHALLSASGAHRWINCPPSALLEDALPDSTSDAAAEGTAAHELAEHKLRVLLDLPTTRPESPWHTDDMDDHTDQYADHVMAELARAQETSPAAFIAIEERIDFSHLVEDGFGTGDAMIVADDTMTIVDLKYGKGVEVTAVDNPQMKLYALGALRNYGMIYNVERVRLVIFQPRRNNISVWETTIDELNAWATEVIIPAARLAHAGDGEMKAGEWCQFCRHAPQCTTLAKQHFQMIPTTPGADLVPEAPDPTTLSDDQIGTIVTHAGAMKKWLTAVEKHALDQANTGHEYPGLKLVEGRSVRKYADEQAVAAAVAAVGEDPWERKLLGITAMTKKLGKKQFDELLGDHLHKPAGAPTLVPVSDKRPALQVATADTVFTPIQETA